MITIPSFSDERGTLGVVHAGLEIPFDIKRVYYIYKVPAHAKRAGHAHVNSEEMIIPVAGYFDVLVDDGFNKQCYKLTHPSMGLYIAPMMWIEIDNFSDDAVCLVLSSIAYDELSYCRDYSAFIKAVKR